MKTIFLSLFFTFSATISFGQIPLSNLNNNSTVPLNLPVENVYVHINSANFFVGENIYYKVYTTTQKNNKLSTYSKVAYISLVGPHNTIFFTHKVRLSSGQGYGDFLIPTEIPSGNYKLVAYTKMSLNQSQNNAFVTDLSIINPYTILNLDLVTIVDNNSLELQTEKHTVNPSNFKINLDKQNFGKREQVKVQLTSDNEVLNGSYSISVAKLDSFNITKKPNILNFGSHQKTLNLTHNKKFLPELRGELITGKLTATESGISTANQPIAFSIPEENFIFKVGHTDLNGNFFINIDELYSSNTAIMQVLNNDKEKYEFSIDQHPTIDFSSLNFEKLILSEELKEHILKRSIKNQIENSYFSVKQNNFSSIEKQLFFEQKANIFLLNDFTRFPTLNETFTEIINNVSFERKSSDRYDINVRALDFELRSPFNALVLIDGLLIQDHSQLFNYNAYHIKQISVLRDKYFYGGMVFQGLVYIETFEKNYHETVQLPYLNQIELFRPELLKEYFKVDYGQDRNQLKNLPDFRTQLLWMPLLAIESSTTIVDFYTSDEPGTFEIVIEGFTDEGQPLKATKLFTVN